MAPTPSFHSVCKTSFASEETVDMSKLQLDGKALGLKELRLSEGDSSKGKSLLDWEAFRDELPQGYSPVDWEMVDLTDELEKVKLDEGDTSQPKPSQDSDWLVIELVRKDPVVDEGSRWVIPAPPQAPPPTIVSSKGDNFTPMKMTGGDAISRAPPIKGYSADSERSSIGGRVKRRRNKKKQRPIPYTTPPSFKAKKMELICFVCGMPGHVAHRCFHGKGKASPGQCMALGDP